MKIPDDELKQYINHKQPFGPIRSEDIDYSKRVNRYFFGQYNHRYLKDGYRCKIIVGRKGSGKTTYLKSVSLDESYSFVIAMNSPAAFATVIKSVHNMLPESITPGVVAKLWRVIIDHSVMLSVLKEDDYASQKMPLVCKYLTEIGLMDDIFPKNENILWKILDLINKNAEGNISLLAKVINDAVGIPFEHCRDLCYQYLVDTKKKQLY